MAKTFEGETFAVFTDFYTTTKSLSYEINTDVCAFTIADYYNL